MSRWIDFVFVLHLNGNRSSHQTSLGRDNVSGSRKFCFKKKSKHFWCFCFNKFVFADPKKTHCGSLSLRFPGSDCYIPQIWPASQLISHQSTFQSPKHTSRQMASCDVNETRFKQHRPRDLICTNCSDFCRPSLPLTSPIHLFLFLTVSHFPLIHLTPLWLRERCDKTVSAAAASHYCVETTWLAVETTWLAVGRRCLITLSAALKSVHAELCSFHFLSVLRGSK